MNSAYFFQLQSLIIFSLMTYGVLQRKNRIRHVRIMSLVIAWDILLILQIELTRSAIVKASKVITNTLMLNIHVSLAVSTVVLYGVMVYTGRKMLRDEVKIRPLHRFMGLTTYTVRLLTLITSYFAK